MRALRLLSSLVLPFVLVACGDDEDIGEVPDPTSQPTPEASPDPTPAATATPDPCDLGDPGPADRDRVVLISHGNTEVPETPGTSVRSLLLSSDGTLSDTGIRLDVGERVSRIAFVPSGRFAIVLGERSRTSVVAVSPTGELELVDQIELLPSGMDDLLIEPDDSETGVAIHVVAGNVDEVSGGLRLLRLSCEGQLTEIADAFFGIRLAESLQLGPGPDQAMLLGGQTVFEPIDNNDIRWLERDPTTGGWRELLGFDLYGDIVSAGRIALSPDGGTLVVPNGSIFSSEGGQLAVVEVSNAGLRESARLTDLPGLSEAIFGPAGDTLLVSQPESNRVLAFSHADGALTQAEGVGGIGLADELVQIQRGALAGRVFIPSVDVDGTSNVAMLQIGAAGVVEDLGQVNLGPGFDNIPDAIGVMP